MRQMSLEELAKWEKTRRQGLVAFPIGGLVWAACLWRIAEKRDAASRGSGTSP
jgi:hypothetical protein